LTLLLLKVIRKKTLKEDLYKVEEKKCKDEDDISIKKMEENVAKMSKMLLLNSSVLKCKVDGKIDCKSFSLFYKAINKNVKN
jgi:hypothetical protein